MVVVPANGFGQVSHHIALFRIAQPVCTGQFTPDQQAQPVRPVEIPGIFELLVLARAVIAHLPGELHIAAQRLVTGGGEQSVRPVALIQDEPLIQHVVVEQHLVAHDLHLAHAKIGFHMIDHLPVHQDLHR